jgi:hypothetical protein
MHSISQIIIFSEFLTIPGSLPKIGTVPESYLIKCLE